MDRGSEIAQPQPEVKTSEESVPLTPEQRELLRSFQQAARGETRPAKEFMEEWRREREAEDNAH